VTTILIIFFLGINCQIGTLGAVYTCAYVLSEK